MVEIDSRNFGIYTSYSELESTVQTDRGLVLKASSQRAKSSRTKCFHAKEEAPTRVPKREETYIEVDENLSMFRHR